MNHEHPLFPGWLQCNPSHPMPPETERDQMGQKWMHDLARSDGVTVHCPACGHRWADNPEEIERCAQMIAGLKAKGVA